MRRGRSSRDGSCAEKGRQSAWRATAAGEQPRATGAGEPSGAGGGSKAEWKFPRNADRCIQRAVRVARRVPRGALMRRPARGHGRRRGCEPGARAPGAPPPFLGSLGARAPGAGAEAGWAPSREQARSTRERCEMGPDRTVRTKGRWCARWKHAARASFCGAFRRDARFCSRPPPPKVRPDRARSACYTARAPPRRAAALASRRR